jgi:hypothetical protein
VIWSGVLPGNYITQRGDPTFPLALNTPGFLHDFCWTESTIMTHLWLSLRLWRPWAIGPDDCQVSAIHFVGCSGPKREAF